MAKVSKEEIKKNLFNRNVFWATIFFTITATLNPLVGKFVIPLYAPDRVSPNDLFFTFFPYIRTFQHFDRIVLILMFILFVYAAIKSNCKCIHEYFIAMGIMYLVRAIVILFTPLGVPVGIDLSAVDLKSFFWDSGFFFSGHTAGYVLTYLYLDKEIKGVKYMGLVLLVLGIMMILFGRHHYMIDIYGGIVTALLIYEYMKRFKM